MAFSATTRFRTMVSGPLTVAVGDWSGAAGDTAGTLSIAGKYIGSLWFKNDTTSVNSSTSQIFPVVNWDAASPGTLTIQNQDNVTTGNFIIFLLGF